MKFIVKGDLRNSDNWACEEYDKNGKLIGKGTAWRTQYSWDSLPVAAHRLEGISMSYGDGTEIYIEY